MDKNTVRIIQAVFDDALPEEGKSQDLYLVHKVIDFANLFYKTDVLEIDKISGFTNRMPIKKTSRLKQLADLIVKDIYDCHHRYEEYLELFIDILRLWRDNRLVNDRLEEISYYLEMNFD